MKVSLPSLQGGWSLYRPLLSDTHQDHATAPAIIVRGCTLMNGMSSQLNRDCLCVLASLAEQEVYGREDRFLQVLPRRSGLLMNRSGVALL
ncbi:MAG: hypothetical protein PF495_18425 [Spirochaetales bacterium]|jgi:hypothetical protein|nr:hypothetical protein [Spirochaetales bacterium]